MDTIALITGANRGIGFQTARLLASRGVRVLAGARDEQRGRDAEAELRRTGDVKFVPLDVTDPDSIAAAAARVESTYGRLDVLVNNAALFGTHDRPSGTTLETLRQVYEVNVFGVVAVTNAMLPLLRRSPAARIVNVSSEVGSLHSMTDPTSPLWNLTAVPYPSSKAALNMVTAMYAKELHGTSIKVNAANPGYCATEEHNHDAPRTAEQGAEVVVELATLDDAGPSGILWGDLSMIDQDATAYGRLAW